MLVKENKIVIRDFVFFISISIILFIIKYPIEMSDFHVYYITGERIITGENVYNLNDSLEFKYLPVTALVFSVFSLINSEEVAKILWYFISAFLILSILYSALRWLTGVIALSFFISSFYFLFYTWRESFYLDKLMY